MCDFPSLLSRDPALFKTKWLVGFIDCMLGAGWQTRTGDLCQGTWISRYWSSWPLNHHYKGKKKNVQKEWQSKIHYSINSSWCRSSKFLMQQVILYTGQTSKGLLGRGGGISSPKTYLCNTQGSQNPPFQTHWIADEWNPFTALVQRKACYKVYSKPKYTMWYS